MGEGVNLKKQQFLFSSWPNQLSGSVVTAVCGVVACRRKRVPPPPGPAHWSTHVTVTPNCRSRYSPASWSSSCHSHAKLCFNAHIQGNSNKRFGSCLYTIYLSLYKQTAETSSPKPFAWIPLYTNPSLYFQLSKIVLFELLIFTFYIEPLH